MKNKANGPADCLVTEMLRCLPTGDGVRGGALVRQAVQGRMSGSGDVEDSSSCVSQEAGDFAGSAQSPF